MEDVKDDDCKLLSELQLITSMYSGSDVHFDDPEVSLRLENSLPICGSVSMTVKLNERLQLSLRIPGGYSKGEEPISINCSCKDTSSSSSDSHIAPNNLKILINRLNTDLALVAKNGINGEPSDILGLLTYCSEQWESLVNQFTLQPDGDNLLVDGGETSSAGIVTSLCRTWIHSHHIYNEKKRKFIMDNASNLSLSGFSLPGKPGFICVEGETSACDEFWSRIRQLSWQKISLIEQEPLDTTTTAFDQKDFTELHVDMSAFIKYLNDKGISSVIKRYLGF